MAERISSISKIPITSTLGKYLGTPSITGRLSDDLYSYTVEKIATCMSNGGVEIQTPFASMKGRTCTINPLYSSIFDAVNPFTSKHVQ